MISQHSCEMAQVSRLSGEGVVIPAISSLTEEAVDSWDTDDTRIKKLICPSLVIDLALRDPNPELNHCLLRNFDDPPTIDDARSFAKCFAACAGAESY